MPRSAAYGPSRSKSRPPRKKKLRSDPARNRARSRSMVARRLPGSPQDRLFRSGSPGDGGTLGHASRGSRGPQRTPPICSPGGGATEHPLPMWAAGSVSGITVQADPDRGGPGGSLASLLSVPTVSQRAIPRGRRTGYRKYGVLPRSAPHASRRRPGGPLRSRTPADETAGRSGGNHKVRGARGGAERGRYNRPRTSRDPAGHAVGPADPSGTPG